VTRARWGALVGVAFLILAVSAFALTRVETRQSKPGQPPALLLLTSLPLLFGEHFSLEETGSPALKALQSRYRVLPISVTSPADLSRGRLLFMAHPLAQPAEDLVALDDWVRRGGRVLLLADPMLDWPSERPLGDPLRPPPTFMDTGLLKHWGLRLDAPDTHGLQARRLGDQDIMTASPGALSGRCSVTDDRLVARCKIGRGRATIVADADLLDAERLGEDGKRNLDALLAELAWLQHS